MSRHLPALPSADSQVEYCLESDFIIQQMQRLPRYDFGVFLGARVKIEGEVLEYQITPSTTPLLVRAQHVEIIENDQMHHYRHQLVHTDTLMAQLKRNAEQAKLMAAQRLSADRTRLELDDLRSRMQQLEQRQEDELAWMREQRMDDLTPSLPLSSYDWLVSQLTIDLQKRLDWEEMENNTTLPAGVRLSGDASVGSGVLLDTDEWFERSNPQRYYLLTAYHVVRDIVGSEITESEAVDVELFYDQERPISERVSARRLFQDIEMDLALLTFDSPLSLVRAKLAPTELVDQVRIGRAIQAVGCPLGNVPIATIGTISQLRHRTLDNGDDRGDKLMITAPTFVGNSGGGIFVADRNAPYLVSIFVQIYTHGTLRPTIIPHMGIGVHPHHLRAFLHRGFAVPQTLAAAAR